MDGQTRSTRLSFSLTILLACLVSLPALAIEPLERDRDNGSDRHFGRTPPVVEPTPDEERAQSVQLDSAGTEFYFIYSDNALPYPGALVVITSEQDTSGSISLPAIGLNESWSVSAGSLTTVTIPPTGVAAGSDRVLRDFAIHLQAEDEVTVYMLNPELPQATNDAYLALPVDIFGTHYRVLAWPDTLAAQNSMLGPSEMAVVGAFDGTTVTVTPAVSTGPHTAGISFEVSLDAGDVYVLQAGLITGGAFQDDLTGTLIESDLPVGVFAGNRCANIPAGFGTCDHVIEQLFPVDTWGRNFCLAPFAGPPLQGDVLRVVAALDDTEIQINGVTQATLAAGQVYEQITFAEPMEISTTAPVMVAQFHTGSDFGGDPSDPSMSLVPPAEQFLDRYTFLTPQGYDMNYVRLLAPASTTSSCLVDGSPVTEWNELAGTSFAYSDVPLEAGAHRTTCDEPFGIQVYGYFQDTSYSYPGGLKLEKLIGISLTPVSSEAEVGQSVELVASVKDDRGDPSPGIEVTFEVIAGPSAGRSESVTTDADGIARFVYGASSSGTDTVQASFAGDDDSPRTSNLAEIVWTGTGSEVPVAECAELETAECMNGAGDVVLDGSSSLDPGGQDVRFSWSSDRCRIADPSSAVTDATCPIGSSEARLVVDNGSALSEPCTTQISVIDSQPPQGGLQTPTDGACYGPSDVPVQMVSGYRDACEGDAQVELSPSGPFSEHGDHEVTVTASDSSGNETSSTITFTVDTVPPTVKLIRKQRYAYRFPFVPVDLRLWASDRDGASGDVVRERILINQCVAFDGVTYGDGDGLLRDEQVSVAPADLCALAERCGFSGPFRPTLTIEAYDCAGNRGTDTLTSRGVISIRGCGATASPKLPERPAR